MTSFNRILGVTLAMVFGGGALAHAQIASSSPKKLPQLVILSATVDRASETMTIHGTAFGSRAPQVWCGLDPMTVISATDSDVVVELPAEEKDGTHRLTVLRSTAREGRG